MTDTTPNRPRTRVVPEGNRWQARYFDPTMRLWFDLGDPRDTESEARELAANVPNTTRTTPPTRRTTLSA
jgi:hypothetical protein